MKKYKFLKNKKLWIVAVLEIVIGSILLGVVTDYIHQRELKSQQNVSEMNAMVYSERLVEDINSGIHITDSLEQIVISEDGRCDKFNEIAENLINDSIQSIQLAPDGVVTEIYPEKGNEAGKIDLLHDEARGEYARYGMENDIIVSQGPFDLKQGGKGIAIRNPVYLNKNGKKEFWGFTIVIIRVPDIFSSSFDALENFGYQYKLLKTSAPWSQDYVEVYSSTEQLKQPMSYEFSVGGDTWKLQIMPQNGWKNTRFQFEIFCCGLIIILLLTGLTISVLFLEERRKSLRILSETDALTGILNRNGFDQKLDQYLAKYSDTNCVVAVLDIDNFKVINDMYGHAAGDLALQSLVSYMRKAFSDNVILGRNGGDEFCIIFPAQTCESIHDQLNAFTDLSKNFQYKGAVHSFTISLGYAEYPKHAGNRKNLMKCADAALYEVKLRGKRGCLAYKNGIQKIRTQLGFGLKDISENLPGAFLIYKADPKDDQLLFANHEMQKLAGCSDMDDFFAYTGRSFRNLIVESEQQETESNIWKQINIDTGHSNDYVTFSLVRKDGTQIKVLDYGRIVDNTYYGRVFYVLMVSQKSIERHYGKNL